VPHKQIRRVVVLLLGWALVALGIVGLFLPVLQGVLFLLLGLYVLSRESKTAHHWVEKLRESHPHLDEKLHRWKERFKKRKSTPNGR
jgi:uncharacterized membrane protein YbaN (DUF454 family)